MLLDLIPATIHLIFAIFSSDSEWLQNLILKKFRANSHELLIQFSVIFDCSSVISDLIPTNLKIF